MNHGGAARVGRSFGEADANLAAIVHLIRTGAASTRPEIQGLTGLTRAVVTQRVSQAIEAGIVDGTDLAESTGGRAPRRLRFRSEAAVVYSAVLGGAHLCAGITDLAGQVIASSQQPWAGAGDPAQTLDQVGWMFDELAAEHPGLPPVWAIGLGIPGSVDFSQGRPLGFPDMPRWNDFDIRSHLEERFHVPVWVDNDLNVMALTEQVRIDDHHPGRTQDFILIKVSYGIGAAIVAGGQLQRGHSGSAGDIGHSEVQGAGALPCRCGQTGCIETVASGWALVRDAAEAARNGRSDYLRALITDTGKLTPDDIRRGAQRYDHVCMELIGRSASFIGETVGTLVSYLNPAKIFIGGILPSVGDLYLVGVRRAAYRHGLPLPTRDLQILPASLLPEDGIAGAANLAVDQLFGPRILPTWLPTSTSTGSEAILASAAR